MERRGSRRQFAPRFWRGCHFIHSPNRPNWILAKEGDGSSKVNEWFGERKLGAGEKGRKVWGWDGCF